jgi:methyl-accepting chemotaxis protein
MADIAKLAQASNEAAGKAIATTDKAQETVLGTVQGITAIRDVIRETEKRIKRLGERSQEIGGVVNLINNIAERTHILALNASMHAASAGEAGRGFAVVANEVQRLAENAREATAQISTLVSSIQTETAETVTTMNETISQVVEGTKMAEQAGAQMRETRASTAELVQIVGQISKSSSEQAEISLQLAHRAGEIEVSTKETLEVLQKQSSFVNRLVEYSSRLVESVSVFTLPRSESEQVPVKGVATTELRKAA